MNNLSPPPMPGLRSASRPRDKNLMAAINALARLVDEAGRLGVELEAAVDPPSSAVTRAIFTADDCRVKLEEVRALVAPY